jgi:ADP-ribose pyrophosphatase
MLDRKGEAPKTAAKRELLEETGYLAEKFIRVVKFPPAPWISTEKITLFFAPRAEFVGKPNPAAEEEIRTIKVPLKKLFDFLLSPPKNTAIDLKILNIFFILKKKRLI